MSSSVVLAETPPGFDAAWKELARFFHAHLEEQQMVGGSLWFFHDGGPIAREHYGFADLGERRAVDENTFFHWGFWAFHLESGATRKITDLDGKRGTLGAEPLATDRRFLYFRWHTDLGDIWVMDVVTDEDR